MSCPTPTCPLRSSTAQCQAQADETGSTGSPWADLEDYWALSDFVARTFLADAAPEGDDSAPQAVGFTYQMGEEYLADGRKPGDRHPSCRLHGHRAGIG